MDRNGTAELQGLVVQTLEARGSLANLRASLRAAVYCAIHEQGSDNKDSLLPPPENLEAVQAAPHGRLMLELVREALVAAGFQKTLSVFDHESASGGDSPLEVVHAAAVGAALSAGPSLTGQLENAATQGLPLLLALMQCCASDDKSYDVSAANPSAYAVSSVPEAKETFSPTSNDAPLSPPKAVETKVAPSSPSNLTAQSPVQRSPGEPREGADDYSGYSFEEDKNVSDEDVVSERGSMSAEKSTDAAVEAFTPPSPPRASPHAPKEPMAPVTSVEVDGEASDSDVMSEHELGSEPDDSDGAEGASGAADSQSFSEKPSSKSNDLREDFAPAEDQSGALPQQEQDTQGQEEKAEEFDSSPSAVLEAADEDAVHEYSDVSESAALAQQLLQSPSPDDTRADSKFSDEAAAVGGEGQDNMSGMPPVEVASEHKALADVDGPSPEWDQGDVNATSTSDQSDHDIPPPPPPLVVPDASPAPNPLPPPSSSGSSLPPLSNLSSLQPSLAKLNSATMGGNDDDDNDEYDFDQGVKPKEAIIPNLSASVAHTAEPRASEGLSEEEGRSNLEVAEGANESDADALMVSVGESEASFGDLEVMCDEIEVAEAYTPSAAAAVPPPPPPHELDQGTHEALKPPPAADTAEVADNKITENSDKECAAEKPANRSISGKAEASEEDDDDEYGSDFDDDDASAEAEELDDDGDEIEVAASDDEDAYVF